MLVLTVAAMLFSLAQFNATAALAAPAFAAVTPAAVSPTLNQFGFPDWYQDTTGTRLDSCLDINDPFCVVLPNPGVFDPALPMDMPDNFPDEFFYSVIDSDKLTTPGCNGTRPGKAFLRIAVEGAFVNGLPADNEQMVFGRVRVRITSGLCPNTAYTFTHPFGTMTLTTNEFGGTRVVDGTQDIGCAPVSPQTCDFSLALRGPVNQSFLRWDPAVAPAAPVGYLGDAITLHTITGATYEPGGAGTGFANYFAISDAVGEVLRSDQFTVMGREAGPVLANTALVDFGGQNINTGLSPARLVTLTNVGVNPLTISAISATPALRFVATDPNACIGRALARDESCAVAVQFDPTVVGQLAGALSITHNGIRSPFIVALAGTGTNPGNEAILTPTPLSLNFGSVRIRTQSLAQRVRVKNTGVAPLQISSAAFMDTIQSGDAAQFVKTSDKCTNVVVQPAKTCDINVAVRPTGNGPLNAVLHLVANVSGGPVDITLTAIGTGGIAAVSAVIDQATGYPTWYQDENGLRISECIDPSDPFCVVLADEFYDPSLPLQGRTEFANFPTEFFYTVADSDLITTPGCANSNPPIPAGRAFIRSAVEAAFVNPAPTDGEQMVFGRVRIVVRGGLCPDTTYTFTHPYGQTLLTTDDQGSIKPAAGTVDIGCFPVAPDLCNFADALQSPVLASFVQWDPAVAPAAPAGYIGDAATLHRITGSPVNNNFFRIDGPTSVGGASVTIGQTTLFTVMGKLNGPLVANPSSVAFPPYTVGVASGNEQITLTNEGITSLTINSLVLGGPNAGDFIPDGGCNNAFFGGTMVLAAGASCNFNVLFAPTAAGSRDAWITVNHTGRNTGFRITMNGVGRVASGPAISVSPASLAFTDLHTGQVSQSMSITVSNLGGLEPLVVGLPTVNSAEFQLENNCIDPVAIDGTCTIKVRFAPTVGGLSSGTIDIPSNVVGAVTTVAVSGRGFAGAPAVSATIRSDGFADWYQDDNGVRVEPCLNASDPNCIVLADAGFDPGLPLVFPTNYPSEFFYQIADSDLVPTDGCGGTTAPGTAHLRMALEGSFAGAIPEVGQQITFARIRIVVTRGLCANTSYTFTTPYGIVGPFLTNTVGGIPANAGTTDIDPPIPSPVLNNGLLRWDPAFAPAAPAGYLGDAISLHRIVGSRYIVVGETEPANYFAIDGTAMRTDLFSVSGKLAGPIMSAPASLDFGNVNELSVSPDQTVTLTNVSPDSVSNFVPTLSGPNAGDFQVTGGTCGVGAIGQDQSCTVTVRFAPQAIVNPSELKSATLTVAHSGLNSPATVALSGTAINVALPAVTLSPTSVTFASQNVGTVSASVNVTVTNSGTADLHVASATLIGANPGDFQLTNNCVLAVIPGGACTLQVAFAPTAGGARTAQIQLIDDAPTSPQLVNLSGTGVQASLSLSPTSLSFSAGLGGSSTKSVNITNTGTANLTILSLTISGSTTFTVAGHNCGAAILPGKNCTVNVRFAPTSRINFVGTLVITSNASGSPHSVALSGTGK
ncbi:MAG: choice-of-anchor D domain-containing protein [Chloroflexi bacterium]|nr:choice-of-anchor D domain-containing protein [Chloroflexota bacterium]